MNSKQKGFSLIYVFLLLVTVGIIGGTGWYLYKTSNRFNKTADNATKDSSEQIQRPNDKTVSDIGPSKEQQVMWKAYQNTDYGFKFRYPSTWKIEEQLSDAGRGKPEG